MLVDSHCHLDFSDFGVEAADVITRAKSAGVGVMQTICTKLTEFPNVLKVAESYDDIYASVGVHPHEAEPEGNFTESDLHKLTQHKKVIGIGETGLDYYYEHSQKEPQKISFLKHIHVAQETELPLIIHTRDAEEDTLEILTAEMQKKKFTGLLHCFTGTQKLADAALELGLYISISGIVTFKNAVDLQNTVRTIPLERLIIETDAPYLAPVPMRGKRNEPAYLTHTAQFIAKLRGITVEDLAEATTQNFFRLFTKAARPV